MRRSPLFRAFESLAGRWAGTPSWPTLEEYTRLAEEQRLVRAPEQRPLEFVPAPKKSRRHRRSHVDLKELYDGSIALQGRIPCLSASYHDLWNAVIFAAFPRAKRALHARQYRALRSWAVPGARQLPSRRTREQDALTVFDEGGSVVVLAPRLYDEWRGTKEHLELAPCPTAEAAPVVFGHALLELAQYDLPAIRSSAVVLPVDEVPVGNALFECIDIRLSARLGDSCYFNAPGSDAALELDRAGRLWLSPPGAKKQPQNSTGTST